MKLKTLLEYILIAIAIFTCYANRDFLKNFHRFIYWKIKDKSRKDRNVFPHYGVWFFLGPQGSGKSISVINQLEQFRKEYPKLKIYTNMGYANETAALESMQDLLDEDFYNGEAGTIFVLDEIQNEFAASSNCNFPHSILSLVTQQRKNHILILVTSQVFSRVQKPLREQCYKAIECSTFCGRYTVNRVYDGIEYSDSFDKSDKYKKEHRQRLNKTGFIQTDELRNLYDSYKLIKKLSRDGFKANLTKN